MDINDVNYTVIEDTLWRWINNPTKYASLLKWYTEHFVPGYLSATDDLDSLVENIKAGALFYDTELPAGQVLTTLHRHGLSIAELERKVLERLKDS